MSLISWKRESGLAARTRIHDGFGSLAALACGTILMIFCWPFCFTPASRTEVPHDVVGHALADLRRRARDAQIARLRDLQAAVTAGVDGGKGGEVHIDVEREPMVSPASRHANAERGDLGALDIDPWRTMAALGARTD